MSVVSRSPEASAGVAENHPQLLARLLRAWSRQQRSMLTLKSVPAGRYLEVDPEWAHLVGRDAAQVTGLQDSELFEAGVATALRAADQTAMQQAQPLWSEHRFQWQGRAREFNVLRVVQGEVLACLWHDAADERQREAQLRAAHEQVEQLQQANATLRRELADQALRDPASGLYTRAHFEDQLRREVDLSHREHREFALVLVELDPPVDAALNLGERARVQVLESIGRVLRGGTRAMDASCRYDDKRFAVLLSGVGLATAHSRMEGLRRRCATQVVVVDGCELGFTVAMGVASFPHTAQGLPELVAACEAALTEARRRGGNHVTLASISLAHPG